jgi:hypothetical protein
MARNMIGDLGTSKALTQTRVLTRAFGLERVKGIEPSLSAWENRLDHPAWSVLVPETGSDVRIRCNAIRARPGSDG